ncbi:MAG: hypothetical protein P8O05_09035, partial [Flavobacteriales bacterium]|nr:hypothetical protein [Flavobacteriales bacterium]
MRLTLVESKKDIAEFHKVPSGIYKNDSNWIPYLKQDVEKTFDPKKNRAFRNGKAARWVLKGDDGTLIGRIAAFVNQKYAKGMEQP